MKTLYYLRVPSVRGAISIKPRPKSTAPIYENLNHPVNLKRDLGWLETKHLLPIISGADMWDDFPIPDHTLIAADQKFGTEDQRLDLLYLNRRGELIAGELKIGGVETDSHGQLLRYIADLDDQEITWDWVENERTRYLRRFPDITADFDRAKFARFRSKIKRVNKPRLARSKGFLLDEGFPAPLIKSVQYLAARASHQFTLIKISTFGRPHLTPRSWKFHLRIEIAEQAV